MPLSATNSYDANKPMVEDVCHDLEMTDKISNTTLEWSNTLLRYFNPVGTHWGGLIDPSGAPNNLMPYISQVASGKLEQRRG